MVDRFDSDATFHAETTGGLQIEVVEDITQNGAREVAISYQTGAVRNDRRRSQVAVR